MFLNLETSLMTHTEKMNPGSYFTGMEICTVLSFRVEGSSSLSLWGNAKKQTCGI